MRTNIDFTVTNRNVFGFNQDRVVVLLSDSCVSAAQHLEMRHASKRDRGLYRGLKRRGWSGAVLAGAARIAELTCLAITGPLRLPVRRPSPVLVLS